MPEAERVEAVHRITFTVGVEGRDATGGLMMETGDLVFVVSQREVHAQAHLVVVVGAENVTGELQFHTLVDHLCIVGAQRAPSCGGVEVDGGKNVGAHLVVEVERSADAVVENSEVETTVPCARLLPSQLVIRRRVE